MQLTLHKKWSIPLRISFVNVTKYPQETADLFTFTEEFLNGKLHFLCSVVGGGRRSQPAFIWKYKKSALILQKSVLILDKSGLFVCISEPNFQLKWSFKSILQKTTWNVYRNVSIPRYLPCPEKLLVARVIVHHFMTVLI